MSRVIRSAAVLVVALAGSGAAQQRFTVGVQGVYADYRETAASLKFTGGGVGASFAFALHKLGADVSFASIKLTPVDSTSTSGQEFTAKVFDANVRWRVLGQVSAEVGVTSRKMDPEFAAQGFGAVRIGGRGAVNLGPGADLTVRAHYLAGAKFSGGGTASFPIDLGLAFSLGRADGRLRVTGDYEFQSINRKTTAKAPVQQALLRVGASLGF